MLNRVRMVTALVTVVTTVSAVSACGGDSGAEDTDRAATVVVGVDLQFQGDAAEINDATLKALELYLEQVGGRAGKYPVELKEYDNSTAARSNWDEATCAANANQHIANAPEVAVVGPFDSGCGKIQAPIMAGAPSGPMLMVSHATTYPGLTRTWDLGEPEKYQPGGNKAYARVVTTDDYQGAAAAQFAAKELGVKKCFVLNDGQTFGQGIARIFSKEAEKHGIGITGQVWDVRQPSYTSLFAAAKADQVDCVYLAGASENNGPQLVRDKVSVLGDNTSVKLLAPDGFAGRLTELPEAQGLYLTIAGLAVEQLAADGGKVAQFMSAYQAKYGKSLGENYFAIYAIQALQVILAALEASDGSRKGVHNAVLGSPGVTVPTATSILGKDIHIEDSGDVNAHDISIIHLRDKKESFLKGWTVTG